MNAEFQKALDQLPDSAAFDHTVHHTIDDLCWSCLHELDLVAEREYWLPLAERKRLLKFIQKHGYHVNEANAVYQRGLSVRADECYINE